MSYRWIFTTLAYLVAFAAAWQPPSYSGYSLVWQQNFRGSWGELPSTSTWNIIVRDKNYNNELQRYTKDKSNLRLSGKSTLQLIPQYTTSAPNNWTSARIESKYTFTPTAGKITRLEASLRLAGNPQLRKQGIWPAFWLLGDSNRQGVTWPECGEIDIMENINGEKIGYASLHCDKYPNGICNEPVGIAAQTSLLDSKYHVWRVSIDRRNSNYKSQSITWYLDGKIFHKVTGTKIGNATVWKALAQSPVFVILNVAVGGDWVSVARLEFQSTYSSH
ncbi:endo-13(4)-beta-glucanase [Fusarium albosuccineum]|uniref:Endo-13(4)-beta-glucanase n=1 Tax=Fusarium albosuccineum TaxID=1237068 RepID=A0A8H4PDU0_9HYPO|nr:endo-13(4)-beta-glucanase [Fusarium albosuccineum]